MKQVCGIAVKTAIYNLVLVSLHKKHSPSSSLNRKFQASSHLWLYSSVCVGPGRNPKDRLSHDVAHTLKQSYKRTLFNLIFLTKR